MKKIDIHKKWLTLFFLSVFFSFLPCMSQEITDEIIFYSNDSVFAPLIILSAPADVQWTWADNTSSSALNPVKHYGTTSLRQNRLKVTPWNSLEMINIGYDAGDGGLTDIPFKKDQKVSAVENLNLAAPYLRIWCSSYNSIHSLDFTNFVNLERIECYLSNTLTSVSLGNTPKLWRACFEDNNLEALDLSGCTALEDLRGAGNNYSDIFFSESTEEFNHICVRDNYLTNSELFSDNSCFPLIRELFIWRTNQYGSLKVPATNPSGDVYILAFENYYSSLDLRGALRNKTADGYVDLSKNQLTAVNIDSCFQITDLRLNDNRFDSTAVDSILKKLVSLNRLHGYADLTGNKPPSYVGLLWKGLLEKRSWQVFIDPGTYIPTNTGQTTDDAHKLTLYPNPASDILVILTDENLKGQIRILVFDLNGKQVKERTLSDPLQEDLFLDVSDLASGVYYLNLVNGKMVLGSSFAVVH